MAKPPKSAIFKLTHYRQARLRQEVLNARHDWTDVDVGKVKDLLDPHGIKRQVHHGFEQRTDK
jgi:hypothetical protein